MSLRVLYWNVWCLPSFLTDGRYTAKQRATKLAPHVQDYDLVILNEAWLKGAKDVFSALYPYHYTLPKPFLKVIDSGILILSKYELQNVDYEVYQNGAGWDWFSAKGMIYFQIEVNQTKYNFITTHMQAGDSDCDQRARLNQSRQLVQFINRHKENNLLLVGDLNLMPIYPNGKKSVHCTDMEDATKRARCYHDILKGTGLIDPQPNGDVFRIFTMSYNPNLKIAYGQDRFETDGLPLLIDVPL